MEIRNASEYPTGTLILDEHGRHWLRSEYGSWVADNDVSVQDNVFANVVYEPPRKIAVGDIITGNQVENLPYGSIVQANIGITTGLVAVVRKDRVVIEQDPECHRAHQWERRRQVTDWVVRHIPEETT
jgi:hypothetical protein